MEKFNKSIIFNYKPSVETMMKALLVQEKLGKLNVRMQEVFKDYKVPSRLFAFIESKYSSKIEGIYTTLYDVVNTGAETKQQNLIKPLVDELFKSKEVITIKKLTEISEILNMNVSGEERWKETFGIYKSEEGNKVKIYQPPLNVEEVNSLLEEVINKTNTDKTIVDMIHTHIMFEKVHPFADGNGRLGRLVLQRSLSRLMNFSNVLPLSYSIHANLSAYYEAFEISSNKDLDKGISAILDIILKMYQTTKAFISDVKTFVGKNIDFVKQASNKVTDEMALDILCALQTKSIYLNTKYGLNVKTIDSIFVKLNDELSFNRKISNRNVLFWNIELESLIDFHFKK